MTQGFFQFNNSIINEIRNFTISTFDLLFLSGERGSAKSETIAKIVPELKENNLVLRHFCFENTVIDDFLLNFYDALRNFTMMQKISVKKFSTDNFKEKVSHYFKTIEVDSIIIVENFEKIEDNVEIIDFLSHLASYKNVKIIVVTRNGDKNLFRFKKIRTQSLEFGQIGKEEFKSKLSILSEPMSKETKEQFYEITSGLELYLKMAVKYCSTANTTIQELMDEFTRQRVLHQVGFEEFLVMKFVSLVPFAYKKLLKILSSLSHPVNKEFLTTYKFGDLSQIDYLSNNFLISCFGSEYYVKDYFRQYIVKSLSIQEKVTYFQNLVEIYENELTKSPKDRLLRLSRESIRKEIASLKTKIPSINSQNKTEKAFKYLGLIKSNWMDEKAVQKEKLSEKLKRIKERKNILSKEKNSIFALRNQANEFEIEEKEKTRRFIIDLINSARELARKYQYNDAISELTRAYKTDENGEFEIELLMLIGKNYERLNEFQIAYEKYELALKIAINKRDIRKAEIEFMLALVDKNLFKIEKAKEGFKNIILNKNNPMMIIAKANLELGEIEEANSNVLGAKKCYSEVLEYAMGKDKQLVSKAYYKLAVLYDENQDYDEAIKYYQKNYKTSSERSENKYYSISLTNLALIYSERGQFSNAIEYFKLALIYDGEIDDYSNMYFSQKELAKMYFKIDSNISLGYTKQALDSARKLNDPFKEALVYFEMGELFYDCQEDEKALMNFYNARNILRKISDSENIQRVKSRIDDIKIRLDSTAFNVIADKYDK